VLDLARILLVCMSFRPPLTGLDNSDSLHLW